ncbi:5-hydroxytryptamine receptor 1, partial [Habropoda laboriosa]
RNMVEVADILDNTNMVDAVDILDNTDVANVVDILDNTNMLKVADILDNTNMVKIVHILDNTNMVEVVDILDNTNVLEVVDILDNTDVANVVDILDNTNVLVVVDTLDNTNLLKVVDILDNTNMVKIAILIALVLGIIIVGTVIGNILVCVAVFFVKKLKRPCNYLLVSLAVSDLCVALLVMPMALIYEISGNWSFGANMCVVWVSFDVLSCTASILNLCMISVDRFWAITKPLKYGVKRTTRRMITYIILVWLTAACISLLPLLIMGNEYTYSETGPSLCDVCQNFYYQICATLGSFYIPLIVMIVVYYKILCAARKIVLEERRAQSHLEAHCYLDIEPTVQPHQPVVANRQLNSDVQTSHGSPPVMQHRSSSASTTVSKPELIPPGRAHTGSPAPQRSPTPNSACKA